MIAANRSPRHLADPEPTGERARVSSRVTRAIRPWQVAWVVSVVWLCAGVAAAGATGAAGPAETEAAVQTETGAQPAKAAAPADAKPLEKPDERRAKAASPEDLTWKARVTRVIDGIRTGERTPADADRLFAELSDALWALNAEVDARIRSGAGGLTRERDRLVDLYAERSRLFEVLSPSLQSELTGLDAPGREELRRELGFVRTNFAYQQRMLESGVDHIREQVTHAPSAALSDAFWLFVAVVFFRYWRRWARVAFPQWRKRLLAARPRTRGNLRIAKTLWYVERVRGPVEWLALLWVVTLLVRPVGFDEITTLASTVAKWLLIGVLAVRLLDAMIARASRSVREKRSDLRLRSLRMVGSWAIALGLGLDLTGRYAGHAVVYTWVTRGWLVLSLPVALLLLHWWKPVIFARLGTLAEQSPSAARLAAHESGWGRYTAAAAGVFLVAIDSLVRLLVRVLSGSEVGRRVIAVLVRREVAREMERDRHADETPIADDVILPLIAAREVVIDEVARAELDLLVATIGEHGGGANAVIGERGAGKTLFLHRLADELEAPMRIVDCPVGGWPAFRAMLCEAFEVEDGDDFARDLDAGLERAGVRCIGVDDFHLLPRPIRGGQEPVNELAALIEKLESPVAWVFAIDRHAWRYVRRTGADQAMLHWVVDLPRWTEEQLAELVSRRADATGIDPDYGRLVLPRQLDVGEHDDPEERNRFGYARVLWELADGNPEVSLYLFAESLRKLPDETVILRLPQLRSAGSLSEAHPDALLVLRALVQCDIASTEDIARSVRLSPDRVRAILRYCVQNEWVTDGDRGYRVSWGWFRSVTRALARKNLMAR